MEFSGKVALVTGAGSGIGEATAKVLAAEGARVGILDLRKDRVEAAVNAITAAGGAADPLVADVANEAQMRSAIAGFAKSAGRLDIVVANAGINGVWAPIDEITLAEWEKTIAVNLRGTYLTINPSVPHLKAAGGGAIVIISSINGTRTFSGPGGTLYSATKGAQGAFSNQLAVELGKYKIRVNAVMPGGVRTNIGESTIRRNPEAAGVRVEFPNGDIPLTGKLPGQPDDVAQAVRYLVSSAARHVSGTWLYVDGAQSLLR